MRIAPNVDQFRLLIQGKRYHVDSLTGRERISQLFEYRILARHVTDEDVGSKSPDLPPLSQVVGATASIEVVQEDHGGKRRSRHVHGMIAEASWRYAEHGERHLSVLLVPRLWKLSRTIKNRVFRNQKASQVVQQVVSAYGLNVRVQCSTDTAAEICMQYGESDLAFVHRILERDGIAYWFDHSGADEVLVLADKPDAFDRREPRPHRLKPLTGELIHESECSTFLAAEWRERLETREVKAQDYDYWAVKTREASSSGAGGEGTAVFHPYEFQEADEGRAVGGAKKDGVLQHRATMRLQELRSETSILAASGPTRDLGAGMVFGLVEVQPAEKAGEYLAVDVDHTYHQGAYNCSVVAVPAAAPYRPPRVTPRPSVSGLQTATVVGGGNDEPITDRLGRIKIRFHWDQENTQGRGGKDDTVWVRVAWSQAGPGYGIQFIPRVGMEVVVAFLNGDPDRPMVTGLVYNQANPPPLAEEDKHYQNVIRTQSVSQLWFEDKPGKEEVQLHTPEQKNSLFLYGGSGDHKVTLKTDEGHLEFSCAKNDTHTVGEKQTTTIGKDQSIDVGTNQDVTVGGNHTLKVTGNTTIEGTGAGTLTLKQGGGSITIDPAGNVTIKGLMVTIQGTLVKIN